LKRERGGEAEAEVGENRALLVLVVDTAAAVAGAADDVAATGTLVAGIPAAGTPSADDDPLCSVGTPAADDDPLCSVGTPVALGGLLYSVGIVADASVAAAAAVAADS